LFVLALYSQFAFQKEMRGEAAAAGLVSDDDVLRMLAECIKIVPENEILV